MSGTVPFVVLGVVALLVGIRLLAGAGDKDRIRSYVEERGGTVIDIQWSPFGKGWFGEDDRIYEVQYKDAQGAIHSATCKTSACTGVYWTEDSAVGPLSQRATPSQSDMLSDENASDENAQLRAENDRLKAELDQLRKSQPGL